jgi:transposase
MTEWACSEWGLLHDRDTNPAINLLLGFERRPLVAEILALSDAEDVKAALRRHFA